MQGFLDKLECVHSSEKMIRSASANGRLVRKDAVRTTHPLVRVHPVTGKKCLYINGEFITSIVGLKDPEQKMLMEFLLQHIITGHDFQARVKWSPKTIVLFDNRAILRKSTLLCGDGRGRRLMDAQTLPLLTTSMQNVAQLRDTSSVSVRWQRNPFLSKSGTSSI
jgi:alpha-ketoglutarate-dependent taurine dioxygenase